MSVPVVQVVVVADNGVIGADGGMPWHLPSDLARFKAATMGTPMIMGRRTFESIGRALPGRTSIVVTRDRAWQAEGAVVVGSVEQALDLARTLALAQGAPHVSIVGGGEIYRQTMAVTDRIELTRVLLSPDGDTHYAAPDEARFEIVNRIEAERGPRDDADTVWETWERRKKTA